MAILTTCSACQRQVQVPEEFLARLVKCPLCGNTFTVADAPGPIPLALPPRSATFEEPTPPSPRPPERTFAEEIQPARPRPTSEADSYEESRDRRQHPDEDDDDDFDRRGRRRRGDWDEPDDDYDLRRRRGFGLQGISNNYEIDLGAWFNRARDHYIAVLGPMIGYLALNILFELFTFVPVLGILVQLALAFVLNPALQAGYTIVALAQLQGRRWTFNDFFAGFNWFGALLANYWLTIVIGLVLLLPSHFLLVIVGLLAHATHNENVMFLWLAGAIANVIFAIYPFVRVTCFSVQLIVDRECGPVEAIRGSWEMSRGRFWGLLGVGLLLLLIAVAGMLACFVGFLFALPFVVLTWNAGYVIATGSQVAEFRRARDEDYREERGNAGV